MASHRKAPLKRPSAVPADASYEERWRDENGASGLFRWPEGRADVLWQSNGRIGHVRFFDANGVATGFETEHDERGRITWEVPWVKGQMHGFARQFNGHGHELMRSRFIKGTGLDVYVTCGAVNEVREIANGVPHGIERWGHPLRPWEEALWFEGERCIVRQWEGESLKQGFPQFFVAHQQVTRAVYERARKRRPALPKYLADGDRRERSVLSSLNLVKLRDDIRKRLSIIPVEDV